MSTGKIVRTKTKASGGITNAEKSRLKLHADLWIKRAFRTEQIQPEHIVPAIHGLYEAVGLSKPRVVIVPSPMAMAFAYGAAAAIWYQRDREENSAVRNATESATNKATYESVRAATYKAISKATFAATESATYKAISKATFAATESATNKAVSDATDAATESATNKPTYESVRAATYKAISKATFAAVSDATDEAVYSATYQATIAAISKAIRDATYQAANQATFDATEAATYGATYTATSKAYVDVSKACVEGAANAAITLGGKLGLESAKYWYRSYQGGCMWAALECCLTAFRDVIGLDLPEYKEYSNWEQAAIHGGFRIMHKEFCMVSDFPERILVDENNRPHCENGPSHRWRDGWSLYYWHGVEVPGRWIENRETLDPTEVLAVENVEQRAAGVAIIGMGKMASKLGRCIVDGDPDTDMGALIELSLPGLARPGRFLQAVCPRNGVIVEGVPYVSDVDGLPINTVMAAQAWRDGLPAKEYQHPLFRT